MIRFKLFLMMFLEFFIWGAWLPLIFGYLPALQFTAWQQSLIINAFPAAAILAMFFSNQFADRNFAAERFLAVSHLIGGIAILGCIRDRLLAVLHLHAGALRLLCADHFDHEHGGVRQHERRPGRVWHRADGRHDRLDRGRLAAAVPAGRLDESGRGERAVVRRLAGHVFASDLKGVAKQSATSWTYIVAAVASFVLAGFSLTLPHTPPNPASGNDDSLAWIKSMKLLRYPFVAVLWLVTLVDSFVHNCYFNWTGRFLPTVGIPENWVTVVMSIGQVAEILTMAVLGFFLKALGWRTTLIIGVLGHAVRFAVFAFCGSADYKVLIVTVQVLHGVCYAFFFATVYIFVDEYFPKDIRTSTKACSI